MKKILLGFLLLYGYTAFAQLSTDWGIGYDIGTNKTIATISAGVEIQRVLIEGQLTPSISRTISVNNYFGVKAGYDIAGIITPSFGYYYNYRSAEKKEMNYGSIGYSLKLVLPLTDNNSGIFFNGLLVCNEVQITAGIHAVL